MEKVSCIIVDDEPIARRGMRRLVEMHPELEVFGSAGDAVEAGKLLEQAEKEEKKVKMVFLDIDMEGESGLDFARRLDGRYNVIFTTAFAEYALDSYEVDALDYLLKPIRAERFNKTVERALTKLSAIAEQKEEPSAAPGGNFVTVKADRRFLRLPTEEILYIEGLGDYLVIHLRDRRVTTRMTFKAILEQLPPADFIRINKSYIINRTRVDSFDSAEVKIGETSLPIGTTYRDKVKIQLLEK